MNGTNQVTRSLDLLQFKRVPIVRCTYDGSRFVVVADDDSRKHVLVFQPVQAVRITTEDCYVPDTTLDPLRIAEVTYSQWIGQLTEALNGIDHMATFMDRARHFVIRGYDEVVEVVAHEVDVDPVDMDSSLGA